MKTRRKEKKVYLRFALTMLLCAALGAVAGAGMVMVGKDLLETSQSLNEVLASFGLWWFVPGYLLLAVSTAYHVRGKALLPQAVEEDGAFREADRRLCLALILSGAAMVWLFIALGISIQADWETGHAMFLGSQVLRVGGKTQALLLFGSLTVQLVWITALQVVIIKATKVIHPEKQGNVLDSKFQKDWYQSCDEAERQQNLELTRKRELEAQWNVFEGAWSGYVEKRKHHNLINEKSEECLWLNPVAWEQLQRERTFVDRQARQEIKILAPRNKSLLHVLQAGQ